jgi:hypothetical protein
MRLIIPGVAGLELNTIDDVEEPLDDFNNVEFDDVYFGSNWEGLIGLNFKIQNGRD